MKCGAWRISDSRAAEMKNPLKEISAGFLLPTTIVVFVMASSRAGSLPQWIDVHRTLVGASLLAMAACQAPRI